MYFGVTKASLLKKTYTTDRILPYRACSLRIPPLKAGPYQYLNLSWKDQCEDMLEIRAIRYDRSGAVYILQTVCGASRRCRKAQVVLMAPGSGRSRRASGVLQGLTWGSGAWNWD